MKSILSAMAIWALTLAVSYGQYDALAPGPEYERALRKFEQGKTSTRSKTPKGGNVLKACLPGEPRDWFIGDIGLLGNNAKILQIVSKDKMLIVVDGLDVHHQRIVMLSGFSTKNWTDGGLLSLDELVEITGTTTYTTVNGSTSTVLLLECNSKTIKEIKAKVEANQEAQRKAAIELEKAKKEREAAIEAAKWRTWTDSTGQHKVEAKFGCLAFGVVKLTKRDGSAVKVPLEKLSDEDREWIASRHK